MNGQAVCGPFAKDHPASRGVRQLRTGMTLLEVMLALTLTGVVLVAISTAIDIHLRMLDARRGDVERIQLARAVLQIIARDLRSAVEPTTTDFSVLASMATEAAASGTELDEAMGGDTGGGDTGGGAGGDAGGDMGGGDLEMDDSTDLMLTDELGTATEDIASSSEPPPVPGLYGNQYELQIDVGRIPRVDEMQQMMASSVAGELRDIPSDVKTVAYYLHNPDMGASAGSFTDEAGNPQTGLVRRVMDRAVTLYASSTSSSMGLEQAGEIIAPEIGAIEFQYFDGYEWVFEWDSDEMGGLPVAVRITIIMMPNGSATDASGSLTTSQQLASQQAMPMDETFSLVVRLPTALPVEDTEETDDSGMEAVGL